MFLRSIVIKLTPEHLQLITVQQGVYKDWDATELGLFATSVACVQPEKLVFDELWGGTYSLAICTVCCGQGKETLQYFPLSCNRVKAVVAWNGKSTPNLHSTWLNVLRYIQPCYLSSGCVGCVLSAATAHRRSLFPGFPSVRSLEIAPCSSEYWGQSEGEKHTWITSFPLHVTSL